MCFFFLSKHVGHHDDVETGLWSVVSHLVLFFLLQRDIRPAGVPQFVYWVSLQLRVTINRALNTEVCKSLCGHVLSQF